jgi:hypothetical protein
VLASRDAVGVRRADADRPTAEEVKKEVGEAVEALGAYSAARRDEVLAHPALDRLDQLIDRPEDRPQGGGAVEAKPCLFLASSRLKSPMISRPRCSSS